MTNVPFNGVWINNIPIEFAMPTSIRFTRGTDPYIFQFLTTDPEAFKKLKNPVTITIESINNRNTKETKEFKKWYITSITPNSTGGSDFIVTVQDPRWILLYNKLTANYNVQFVDGKYRSDSVRGGVVPWLAYDALVDILTKFGASVKTSSNLDPTIKSIKLPFNLGNSEAGGWVDGSFSEVINPICEILKCDIVPDASGNIVIVDRHTELSQRLDKWAWEGHVGTPYIKWQKPKEIIVDFEKLVERRLVWDNSGTVVPNTTLDQSLENVVPNIDVSGPEYDSFGILTNSFMEISEYVDFFLSLDMPKFVSRLTLNTIIPDDGTLTGDDLEFLRTRSEYARKSWHKYWRVNHSTSQFATRPYFNMKFGRLGIDGNCIKSNYIFLDYSQAFGYGYVEPGQDKINLANHKFSRNYELDLTRLPGNPQYLTPKHPIPYDASWVGDGRKDLVFELVERQLPTRVEHMYPGLLSEDISYGDVGDIIADNGEIKLETDVELTEKFRLYVYYYGLLAVDSNDFKRVYSTSVQAFNDGEIPSCRVKAEGITANYSWSDTAPNNAYLMNADKLYIKANDIVRQIMATYSEKKFGRFTCATIDVLNDYWVDGNIYEISIDIGHTAPGTIEIGYEVRPEIRNVINEPEKLDGQKPEYISD